MRTHGCNVPLCLARIHFLQGYKIVSGCCHIRHSSRERKCSSTLVLTLHKFSQASSQNPECWRVCTQVARLIIIQHQLHFRPHRGSSERLVCRLDGLCKIFLVGRPRHFLNGSSESILLLGSLGKITTLITLPCVQGLKQNHNVGDVGVLCAIELGQIELISKGAQVGERPRYSQVVHTALGPGLHNFMLRHNYTEIRIQAICTCK
mmetsp:Transcript_32449/g.52559  ORF Transcript_32449/g.52559 Transcript_32449/m.52559 type:complete len:206 (+) Transcript_32449:551-1168(+)